MDNILRVKTAFIIVILSIVSAFSAGGLVMAIGSMSYLQQYQKYFIFLSFIVGQGFMIVPLIWYLKLKNIPIINSIRLKPIKYNTAVCTIIFSIGLIILSDELDRIIQVFVPAPDYIVDLSSLLKPESVFGTLLLWARLQHFHQQF